MRLTEHPLWLVGFRPFFALACLSGLSLPVVWALMFSGALTMPAAGFSSVQWHAHEMFFGFGWAVLGGFLLTSTKNWVRVRGYRGGALMFLAAAWLFERIGMWFGGDWPLLLFRLSNNLFLGAMVMMIVWTLVRYRDDDAYRRDNLFFLVILPLFLVAKALLLSAHDFQTGWVMALGLFRVAFLVMFERTLTQFMKSIFKVDILREPRLDTAIKLLAVALVFAGFMPSPLALGAEALLAALLLLRFAGWKPQLAFTRLDIGVMYAGYLAIVAQLLLDAAALAGYAGWVGSTPVHVFTFGVMGLVVPAMIMRISKGHTGRKVVFERTDKAVLHAMMLGFVLRIVAPQLYPAAYLQWIELAAACWFVAFATLAWRYIPWLLQPRADGKEH
jgi:uncharacterized protein involved in response to NO